MKILFIYSLEDVHSIKKPLRVWSQIQFGISYISALLKAHHHQVELVVLKSNHPKKSRELLKKTLSSFQPQALCFSAVFSQYRFIKETAEFIRKEHPALFAVIGGAHPTLNPKEVIQGPFDALCLGEGEYPLLELCAQMEKGLAPTGIENLWIKQKDGSIERNPTRDFLQDIDSLPFADREIWEPWVNHKTNGQLSVLLGRGCPHECTYCSNHGFKKNAKGKYVRLRSPENIIRELRFVHNKYPHRHIHFESESIALDVNWTLLFCRELENLNRDIHHHISYSGNFRIEPHLQVQEIFNALKKANFYKIHIGLESGSERIRQEVLGRHYTNEQFLDTVKTAKTCGLKVFVFNLIGIPQETFADHLETIRINRLCQPDGHYTSIVCPYPGTDLYTISLKNGLIKKEDFHIEHERTETALRLPHFSKKQIQKAYVWFDYHVYHGYKSFWYLIKRVLHTKIRSTPALNQIYDSLVRWPVLRNIRACLNNK